MPAPDGVQRVPVFVEFFLDEFLFAFPTVKKCIQSGVRNKEPRD
jgi:hypothetical protein